MSRGARVILGALSVVALWVGAMHLVHPLTASQWLLVGIVLLALLAAALGQLRRPVLQYLFFCRFSLLLALSLFAFPVLARTVARPLLGNLFSLRPAGLALVAFLAVLLGWVALVTLLLTADLAPARFDAPAFEPPPWLGRLVASRWSFALALLLAAPTAIVAGLCSPSPAAVLLAAILAGAGAAAALVWLVVRLRSVLFPEAGAERPNLLLQGRRATRHAPPRDQGHGRFDRLAERLCGLVSDGFWRGYIYEDGDGRRRFFRGHLFNVPLLAATLVGYVALFLLQTPGRDEFDVFPALGYTMLLMLLGIWAMAAAAFFLDRYRVPVLLALVLVSFFSFFVSDTDHYYRTVRRGESAAAPTPEQALEGWFAAHREPDGRPPVLVAVTAVGGGVTTALWTDWVLYRLEREPALGERFVGSIGLVSGVSGGSVGALYFFDALASPERGTLDDRLARAVDSAAAPSLPEATWGLVYPDFWRTLPGPWFRWREVSDRGEALERAWERRMLRRRALLSGWRRGIREGRLPAPVFNATVTETGDRMLLTPLEVPTAWQARSFYRLYPEADLRASTAARLSATFPYVTPIARPLFPRDDRRGYHLADGGYYDNYGVATLLDWLQSIEEPFHRLGGRRILLVQIRDAPAREPGVAKRGGWVISALGPLETLAAIRGTTQSARNELEIRLLVREARSRGLEIEPFVFSLAPDAPPAPDTDELPLSWQLTRDEKIEIQRRWETRANRAALRGLVESFARK